MADTDLNTSFFLGKYQNSTLVLVDSPSPGGLIVSDSSPWGGGDQLMNKSWYSRKIIYNKGIAGYCLRHMLVWGEVG